MAIIPDKLVGLVRSGGSARISAREYLPDAVMPVVRSISERVTLIVRHAGEWSPANCIELAHATAKGTLLFEF